MKTKFFSFILMAAFAIQTQAQQIPNASFEEWSDAQAFQTLVGWKTNAGDLINTITREPGFQGQYALGVNQYGWAETGFPISYHPGMFTAYVRTGFMQNDTVSIVVRLYRDRMVVDGGTFTSNATTAIPVWTQVAVPLTLNSTVVDSISIHITGGRLPTTFIVADALALDFPTGLRDDVWPVATNWSVFPNPVTDYAQLRYNLPTDTRLSFTLYDMSGKLVQTYKENEMHYSGSYTEQLDMSRLSSGQYLLNIYDGRQRTSLQLVKVGQ